MCSPGFPVEGDPEILGNIDRLRFLGQDKGDEKSKSAKTRVSLFGIVTGIPSGSFSGE